MGLSHRSLESWERGTAITAPKLRAICDYYNLDPADWQTPETKPEKSPAIIERIEELERRLGLVEGRLSTSPTEAAAVLELAMKAVREQAESESVRGQR